MWFYQVLCCSFASSSYSSAAFLASGRGFGVTGLFGIWLLCFVLAGTGVVGVANVGAGVVWSGAVGADTAVHLHFFWWRHGFQHQFT